MNASLTLKSVGAGLGGLVVYLFPSPILISLLWCLAVVTAVDCITGVAAAIFRHVPVTPKIFIEKVMRKMTRGVSYLALAWVAGQMVGSVMPQPKTVAEPIGFVLGALIAADALSILRNLKQADNNIPGLDKFLKKLFENFKTDPPEGRRSTDRTPREPRPPKVESRS